MLRVDDRVIMCISDGWAAKGWIGTIPPQRISPRFNGIRVKWDNGKTFRHNRRDLALTNKSNDPNIAFLISKRR